MTTSIDPITHIDVSKWIPNISWACMKLEGVKWAATRATVANYYVDPTWKPYSIAAREQGIMIPPYHVTRADKTILGKDNKPLAQMDFFDSAIKGLHDGVVILDVELATGYENKEVLPKTQVTDVNMACWEIATARYDEVYFYSRATFMDGYMALDSRFKLLDLFLAEYGPDDGLWHGSTLVPKGCSKSQIVMHQFSSKGKPFCCDPTVNNLDYDLVINWDRYKAIHKIQDSIPPVGNINWDNDRIVAIEAAIAQLSARLDNAKLII